MKIYRALNRKGYEEREECRAIRFKNLCVSRILCG